MATTITGLKISQDLTPDMRHTSGRGNKKRYIAWHETDNTSRGANAKSHARLQKNNSRAASWTWQVDDHEAIQSFLNDVKTWAQGDAGKTINGVKGLGLNQAISVETCVNSDGNFLKAVDNSAKLIAHIMKEEGIPISHVKQHNFFSGKNCPRYIRAGRDGMTWNKAIGLVKKYYAIEMGGKPSASKPSKPSGGKKSNSMIADEVIAGKWGNNPGRKTKLRNAGYNPTTIQSLVNSKLSGKSTSKPKPAKKPAKKSNSKIADEVIQGKWGNNPSRSDKLRKAGYNPNTIQSLVNSKLGGKPAPAKKSNNTIANEVIRGKWGNNPGRAKKLRQAGYNPNTIQKLVNKKLK